MALTKEQKLIIVNYLYEEDPSIKPLLEGTTIGDDYDNKLVTADEITAFLNEIRERALLLANEGD